MERSKELCNSPSLRIRRWIGGLAMNRDDPKIIPAALRQRAETNALIIDVSVYGGSTDLPCTIWPRGYAEDAYKMLNEVNASSESQSNC